MKKILLATIALIAVLGALFSVAGSARQAADPGVLLRAAIEKEEVDGDLQAAINMYKQVIAKNGRSRAVAAQALLRLGGCYEKLGQEEARKTYQQLIADYAEQQQEVTLARQRLAAIATPLRQENKSVTVRMLWKVRAGSLAGAYAPGEVSPDGGYLSWENEDTGDLAIRDLKTGQSRLLTKQGGWPIGSCWSPDGKRIAYGWWIEGQKGLEMPWELRITDATGKNGTRVLHRSERYLSPTGWFPDAKSILAVATAKGGETDIVRVSLDDGAIQVIKKVERGSGPTSVRLSPDGKYVAYELDPNSAKPDIFLLPASGDSEIPLVTGPYDDKLLAWTPDGRHILF